MAWKFNPRHFYLRQKTLSFLPPVWLLQICYFLDLHYRNGDFLLLYCAGFIKQVKTIFYY